MATPKWTWKQGVGSEEDRPFQCSARRLGSSMAGGASQPGLWAVGVCMRAV